MEKGIDIPLLDPMDIDCRVQQINEKGCSLLLYKDARCDMRILDQVFGIYGWQRKHDLINENLFCTVSILDRESNQWIHKQDVGVESNTERQKGQASDAFKRACFNVGIGRELYSAPFIWINLKPEEVKKKPYKDKSGQQKESYYLAPGIAFHVSLIAYSDRREICFVEIKDRKGVVRFTMGDAKKEKKKEAPAKEKPKQQEPSHYNSTMEELTQVLEETALSGMKALKSFWDKNMTEEQREVFRVNGLIKELTKKAEKADLQMKILAEKEINNVSI